MKPLLSATITDTAAIKYPVFVSQKFDGIRCLILGGRAVSRNLKPIPNLHVQKLVRDLGPAAEGLDGELVLGNPFSPTCFRDTTSAVRKMDGKPDVRFFVFDRFLPDTPYDERLKTLPETGDFVMCVEQEVAFDEADLLSIEADLLARGAEGVMVRSTDGTYKQGRSTLRDGIIGKLKRFADDEFEVIGCVEFETNTNAATKDALGYTKRSSAKAGKRGAAKLGALVCRTATGAVFNVGSGFSDAERRNYWAMRDTLPGRWAKVKHFPIGDYSVPRFPTFLGFRDSIDMPAPTLPEGIYWFIDYARQVRRGEYRYGPRGGGHMWVEGDDWGLAKYHQNTRNQPRGFPYNKRALGSYWAVQGACVLWSSEAEAVLFMDRWVAERDFWAAERQRHHSNAINGTSVQAKARASIQGLDVAALRALRSKHHPDTGDGDVVLYQAAVEEIQWRRANGVTT